MIINDQTKVTITLIFRPFLREKLPLTTLRDQISRRGYQFYKQHDQLQITMSLPFPNSSVSIYIEGTVLSCSVIDPSKLTVDYLQQLVRETLAILSIISETKEDLAYRSQLEIYLEGEEIAEEYKRKIDRFLPYLAKEIFKRRYSLKKQSEHRKVELFFYSPTSLCLHLGGFSDSHD